MTILRTDRKHASNCMTEENGVEKVKKRKNFFRRIFREMVAPPGSKIALTSSVWITVYRVDNLSSHTRTRNFCERSNKMAQVKMAKIKESLIEQLTLKGADIDVYRDLIESYIFYTKLERQMQADIKKNGLSYKAISSTGKEYTKDNPSVKNSIMYNKQRLAILSQMGLSIDKVESDVNDEL